MGLRRWTVTQQQSMLQQAALVLQEVVTLAPQASTCPLELCVCLTVKVALAQQASNRVAELAAATQQEACSGRGLFTGQQLLSAARLRPGVL